MIYNLEQIENIIKQKISLTPGVLGFADQNDYIRLNELKDQIELEIFIKVQNNINFIEVAKELQKLLRFELERQLKIKCIFFVSIYIDDIKVD